LNHQDTKNTKKPARCVGESEHLGRHISYGIAVEGGKATLFNQAWRNEMLSKLVKIPS
jgi:hypothetical protein